MSTEKDEGFADRQEFARQTISQMDKEDIADNPKREEFFETVYDQAHGDAAMVPWADLEPKLHLVEWLESYKGEKGKAADVGCGLGDNAELIAQHGFDTTAFDFSQKAIDWASKRFSQSPVNYQWGDLFDLPERWIGAFDLVHECYTLQSLPPETLEKTVPAIASLLAPGGRLLVYTRVREKGAEADGPPWPLEWPIALSFEAHGLELVSRNDFSTERHGLLVPHTFCEWQRSV